MPSSLAPSLLLSMPQLVDPNFARTVVLLCRHSDKGAFGLVVNRPLVTTGRVVVNLDPPVSTDRELELWLGGPVEPYRTWVLVGEEMDPVMEPAAIHIADHLYLSAAPNLVRRLLEPDPPPRSRLIAGYAGWGPSQLEYELQASAWLLSDVDATLLFDTPAEHMWERALRRIGADPASLQMASGVH